MSMSDNDSGRRTLCSYCVVSPSLSESHFNNSSRWVHHEDYVKELELKAIRPVNNCYREALSLRRYGLANTLNRNDDQVGCNVAYWAKHRQVQMRTSILDPFDPISIIATLSSFKLACATNDIHEGAAMWHLQFSLKQQATGSLKSKILLRTRSSRKCQKERKLTMYCEVINYLLETYATDVASSETNAKTMRFILLPKKSPIEHAKFLLCKKLRGNGVYNKNVI